MLKIWITFEFLIILCCSLNSNKLIWIVVDNPCSNFVKNWKKLKIIYIEHKNNFLHQNIDIFLNVIIVYKSVWQKYNINISNI